MAQTITLRAQGATRASVARFSSPASLRDSMYFISPCFPSAIQAGKTSSSPKSRTGAMPQRSNPASRAHCLMRVGRLVDTWAAVSGQSGRFTRGYHSVLAGTRRGFLFGARGEVLDPVPAFFFGRVEAGVGVIQQHFYFVF